MQFSVIIPVYNREQYIKRALDSALNQSEPAAQIIVVNDGSDDGTRNILAGYGAQIQIIDQANRGVSAARNSGIRAAQYDWLAFLDSDDEWLPDKLKQARIFHEHHPEFQIFQCEEIWVRNGRRVNPKKKHRKYGGWIFRASLPLCIVSPSAVVINKTVFETAGYFDESFPVCEDYDLWLRVARKYPVGLDPNPGIIKYGGHPDQLSRKYWGMDRYRIKALEKHVADRGLPEQDRECVIDEILTKLNILHSGYRNRGKDSPEIEAKIRFYRQIKERG